MICLNDVKCRGRSSQVPVNLWRHATVALLSDGKSVVTFQPTPNVWPRTVIFICILANICSLSSWISPELMHRRWSVLYFLAEITARLSCELWLYMCLCFHAVYPFFTCEFHPKEDYVAKFKLRHERLPIRSSFDTWRGTRHESGTCCGICSARASSKFPCRISHSTFNSPSFKQPLRHPNRDARNWDHVTIMQWTSPLPRPHPPCRISTEILV